MAGRAKFLDDARAVKLDDGNIREVDGLPESDVRISPQHARQVEREDDSVGDNRHGLLLVVGADQCDRLLHAPQCADRRLASTNGLIGIPQDLPDRLPVFLGAPYPSQRSSIQLTKSGADSYLTPGGDRLRCRYGLRLWAGIDAGYAADSRMDREALGRELSLG